MHGEATIKQSLIKDKRHDNLYVLAASQTRDKDALTQEGVEKVLDDLSKDEFDYIVCDSPAGIEKGAHLAMYFADHAVVVVNPEVSSVRDSDRILGLLASKTRRAERGETPITQHLLLTRYNPARVEQGEMLSVKDVEEILGINVVGVIPESEMCSRRRTRACRLFSTITPTRAWLTVIRSLVSSASNVTCALSTCRRRASFSAYSGIDRDGHP